jgi:4-hydroxyphenylpyruvate dioxygenase
MRENPLGVEAFDFAEFAAPDAALLHDLFPKLGFTAVAKHKSKNITLYRQGTIDFLVNEEPDSFAAKFAAEHGPCCTGFLWW